MAWAAQQGSRVSSDGGGTCCKRSVMCSIGEATDVPLMDAQYPRDAATEKSAPACAAQQHLREKVSIATDDVSHPRSTREKSKYTSVRVVRSLAGFYLQPFRFPCYPPFRFPALLSLSLFLLCPATLMVPRTTRSQTQAQRCISVPFPAPHCVGRYLWVSSSTSVVQWCTLAGGPASLHQAVQSFISRSPACTLSAMG